MSKDTDDIKTMLADPEAVPLSVLRSLNRTYPYFSLPAALIEKYHSGRLDDRENAAHRLHLAVATGDRKALYEFANEEGVSFAGIYPPARKAETVTTDSALNTFFANYGTINKAENDLLERLIFNPVPDYAEILAQEETPLEPAEDDSTLSRIDAFLRDRDSVDALDAGSEPLSDDAETFEQSPATPQADIKTPAADDSSLLSESLAKIFIKQQRYERAYEIISNLSLNYPKKSIYFADQLRFLQKLINIQAAGALKQTKNE